MTSLIASVNFAESRFPKGTLAMVAKAINIRSFEACFVVSSAQ